MNVVARYYTMSIEDFLAWEARQELKYEFNGLEPVAMAGGTLQSRGVASVTWRSSNRRQAAWIEPCALRTEATSRCVTGSHRSRYPDGQVICGEMVPGEGSHSSTTPTVHVRSLSVPSDRAIGIGSRKVHEYTGDRHRTAAM